MGTRLDLHEVLCDILGSRSVYFQPPASVKMTYPAIVYGLSGIDSNHANNSPYRQVRSYTVTLIDKNPDSPIIGDLSRLPACRFDRHYVADNLNHYVFTLYF